MGYIEFCVVAAGSPGTSPTLFGYRASPSATCARPGPIIRMQPGSRYKLTLHNGAPLGNPTNLHTHGLHISGGGNADDITREVDGGDCLQYNYTIPADHRGGTFWYHAHRHMLIDKQVLVVHWGGSACTGGDANGFDRVTSRSESGSDLPWSRSAADVWWCLQVTSGAFGLLIISDNGADVPAVGASMSSTSRANIVSFLSGGFAAICGLVPSATTAGRYDAE